MKIHPHMLRHACGFKLANDGVDTRTIQAYLGHKSIQHTVRYTELAPNSVQKLIPGLSYLEISRKSRARNRKISFRKDCRAKKTPGAAPYKGW